jgi:hypothetical protein
LDFPTGDAHGSWQGDPLEERRHLWYGVLPRGERDGNDLSGIVPADIRRSNDDRGTPEDRYNYYDADEFPGGMYTNYSYLSLDALLLTAEILERNGYPAASFGDNGPLRVAEMLRRFADNYGSSVYPEYPWRYFDVSPGYEQLVIHINALYPDADFPSAGDGQRPTHLLAFRTFTHAREVRTREGSRPAMLPPPFNEAW